MHFINLNEKFFHAGEPVLKINNRSFCDGDGLFETMRWHDGKIFYLDDHISRLISGMKFLKMKIPGKFSVSFFLKQISMLIKKNKITGDARIRLLVFRNEGGYYTPADNSVSFAITAEKSETESYLFNKKGLRIDLFPETLKLKNPLSNFKTTNSSIYTLAGIYAKQNRLDDCLILNSDGNIADAVSSNIFIVKDKKIFTPPLSDGCMDGVMRKNILEICKKEQIQNKERSLSVDDVLSADEIFLTNVIQGTRWV